jgi:hypothetical protein
MRYQKGFTAVEAVIIVVVVAILGFGAYFVFTKNKDKQQGGQETSGSVTWQFTGSEWQANGTPPACKDLQTPLDTSLATSVLLPGQYRGGDYKAHGGFRFDNSQTSDIEVRLPLDGQLTGMVRYIEQGELQYLVTFTIDCGLMYRFDHLATLSPTFQEIAETTPEAKVDDTSSLPIENGPRFKAGDVLATAVGFPKMNNISVDFGVYDLRQPNEISKNSQWAALHESEKEQAFFGVCWLDMLPTADKDRTWALVNADEPTNTTSDYCDTPGGQTLDYNDGKPVNG